jgi:hypothetical protein
LSLAAKPTVVRSLPKEQAMPRYYFDVHDGRILAEDEQGSELPDLTAAEQEATRAMADLAHDVLRNGSAPHEMSISVRDDEGRHVLSVSLIYPVHRRAPE